jgi:hypothetical protein
MATQTVEFRSPPSQTITAKLFAIGSDTQVASVSTTEATNRKGTYSAAYTDVAAGDYELIALVGSVPVARWFVTLTLTTATFQARDKVNAELDSAATAALVDLIWDEPLTGATHNVATSSGKRLRQATAFQQIDSTVIDASATTTTFATGLDSAVDNFYNDSMLVFTDGALAGQVRSIVDYVGATKTIILEEALTSAPVNGVAFTIVSLHIHPVSQIQSGLATASALAAAKTILDKVDTGLVVDGAVYQFTANMLELGPSGGGGSSVNVLPATGIVADRSAGATLVPVVGETISQSITLYRTDGTTAISLSGKTLVIVGFGRIGKSLAQYALGCGMKVIAVDRSDNNSSTVTCTLGGLSIDVPVAHVTMEEALPQVRY